MSKPMKDGKKPLSSKQSNPFGAPDDFGNILTIPEDIRADLKAKGLVARWINAGQLHKNQGYHPKGWVPYKRSGTIASTDGLKYGNDPEGLVRRGDCILACKTEEKAASHKAFLANRANRSKNVNAQKAQELRAMMKDQGIQGKVHEGYEENDGDDSNE